MFTQKDTEYLRKSTLAHIFKLVWGETLPPHKENKRLNKDEIVDFPLFDKTLLIYGDAEPVAAIRDIILSPERGLVYIGKTRAKNKNLLIDPTHHQIKEGCERHRNWIKALENHPYVHTVSIEFVGDIKFEAYEAFMDGFTEHDFPTDLLHLFPTAFP